MKNLLLITLFATTLLLTGCGQSDEEKRAEESAKLLEKKQALLKAQHELEELQGSTHYEPTSAQDFQSKVPGPPQDYYYESGYDAQGYTPSDPGYTPATADTGYSTGALIAAGLGGAILGNMMNGSDNGNSSYRHNRTTVIQNNTITKKVVNKPKPKAATAKVDKAKQAAQAKKRKEMELRKRKVEAQRKARIQKQRLERKRQAAKQRAKKKSYKSYKRK